MTGPSPRIDDCDQPRRRRWTAAKKLAIVQESYEPDATVRLVAIRHGIARSQLFRWRKLAAQRALTATSAQEEVITVSVIHAHQSQIRKLQQLLGEKLYEIDRLKEELEDAKGDRHMRPR